MFLGDIVFFHSTIVVHCKRPQSSPLTTTAVGNNHSSGHSWYFSTLKLKAKITAFTREFGIDVAFLRYITYIVPCSTHLLHYC